MGKVTFFATPAELRKWFRKHHASAPELWVGYYKRHTGKPSITWPESVDEALCCGWIDGIRKSLDDRRYTIRFSPRRAGSIWSAVNIRRARTLRDEGRMLPAGVKAFEARQENRSGIYSYEQRPHELPEPYATALKESQAAWKYYQAQTPSYRRTLTWWIISAKKDETRLQRLQILIADCVSGRRVVHAEPVRKKRSRS